VGGSPNPPSTADTPITEKAVNDTEIKGEDLYGDWLVVSRKKNPGKKSRPHLHGNKVDSREQIFLLFY
jgi:hypothetical protein